MQASLGRAEQNTRVLPVEREAHPPASQFCIFGIFLVCVRATVLKQGRNIALKFESGWEVGVIKAGQEGQACNTAGHAGAGMQACKGRAIII